MDLKQSQIGLSWNLDTSNLQKAMDLTDQLIDKLKLNGSSATKDFGNSFNGLSNKIDSAKSKMSELISTQKSINDVSLNSTINSVDKFNDNVNKSINSITRLHDRMKSFNNDSSMPSNPISPVEKVSRNKSNDSNDHMLRNTVIGSTIGANIGNAVTNFSGYIEGMAKSAISADMSAQKIQLAWHTMGVKSSADVASLTSQIGDLTKQANISGADTTQVQKNLYNATNGNIDQTKALTNEMFAFGKSTNMSNDQIVQATGSLGRLFNTSKVRANTFTRITKQMPAMRDAIIQASGESSAKFMADMNSGKVSGTELKDLMVKAASQSGDAWKNYGKTASGALASLQGTQTQLWKDTFKGMAGDANQGLTQLAQLFSKDEKPISQMMTSIGNGLASMATKAISFLVQNQKPLGSIAHSAITIAETLGKAVWGTFSAIINGIGSAFGLVDNNSKKANPTLQSFADIMQDIAKNQGAIKFIATTLTGLFVAKKALAFAGALKEVATSIGLVKTAETTTTNSSKGGILGDLLNYGTVIGGKKAPAVAPINRASQSFELSGEKSSLAGKLNGSSLGTLAEKESNGAFRSAKAIETDGEFASKYGRFNKLTGAGSKIFGNNKLGALVDRGGTGVAKGLTRASGIVKDSSVLSKVSGVASKIPFLDIAAAGTNLIGVNHNNAGNKIGSSAGMLGGSVLGGMFGGPLGAMAGGWAGQKLGGGIGKLIQSSLPKHPFESIENGWDSLSKKIGHSSFGKSIASSFNSIKQTVSGTFNSIGRTFKPVTKGFSDFINAAKKSELVKAYLHGVSIEFKAFGTVAGVAFKSVFSVVKGITIGIGTFLTDEFGGIFKTIGGIFKAGADLLTGHWSKLGGDLKQIGSGILDALTAPFKGAWAMIKSIGSDIINSVKGIWDSIKNMGSKVSNIAHHPIKAIESMFANGSQSEYPNGLPTATRAVVNDGNGPELINFGNNYGMYKGRNVHTILPKGSRVYNAEDTNKMVGVQHFAGGTQSSTKLQIGKNGLADSIKDSGKKAGTNFDQLSKNLNQKNIKLNTDILKTNTDNAKKITTGNKSLSDTTIDNFSDMGKQLNPIWSKTVDAFGTYFNQLGPNAKTGMQGAVDALNQGITGIDKTLSQFGGNNSVLNPIHYAEGTDGIVNQDHLAIVNDAKSGPQTEAIVNQNGGVRYAKGTNTPTIIHKGESVLDGSDTLTAINQGLIPHYAKGKQSKKALRSIAKNNAKNPNQAFNSEFTHNIQLTGSGLQKGLTKMGSNASANAKEGYNWSGAMWKVIDNAINSGSSASGLLGAVEKYGTGKKYVWGATGPDSFDCSGLVQYALKHAFGIDYPRTSGMQIAKASGISRSDAQPGDLIGNDEHIGVVADKGAHHYFSAFNPSSNPNILMTPVNGSYFPGTPKFGRVQGVHSKNDDKSGLKGVSPFMKKLVTAELGSGALSSITKQLSDSGASGNPAGDGVQRWKPLVQKALGALNLSTSSSMIARVLRQINTESSGNPNAIGGTDGLADGRAMGLMQVKPGTFAEYGKPSLGKWNNGYASIYAGINYAKHRYGNSLSYLGQGHGYARGGHPYVGETAWVGENGPELIHFNQPTNVTDNVRSVSALRNQNNNARNDHGSMPQKIFNLAKGAINIIVKGSKSDDKTANAIEKRLGRLFDEGIKDQQGGLQ